MILPSFKNLREQIREKYAINAYAVRNEVSQRITEKAIQYPNASKKEAEMMEHLIYEQLNYVRIKDVDKVLVVLAEKLEEHIKWMQEHNIEENLHCVLYLKRLLEALKP